MKNLIIISIILFFCACLPNTPFEVDSKTPVPIKDSYISLQKRTVFSVKIGSAVIIKDGIAVSNRHLMEKVSGMRGYMAGGIEFPLKNVILSDRFDLAVFEIPCGVGKPIKMGKRVKMGDLVFSAGTTFDSTILDGTVVLTDFSLHHVDIKLPNPDHRDSEGRAVSQGFAYEADFRKGFSGGPIVNSKGELVGINQGKVLEFFSAHAELKEESERTYGIGYHIENVLNEIRKIAPEKLDRCK